MATLKNTTVDTTGAIQLPVGTTSQRPTASSGQVRYNSSFKTVETHDGTRWRYMPDIVRNGLVLNLDAGEPSSYSGSGTTWTDLSGNGNNGTLINGPTYSSANGGSIVFDGVDDYSSSPSSSSFAFGTNDFTLEIWIYPQSFSTYTHMIALPDQNIFALKANITDGAIYFYSPSYTTYGNTSGWTLSLNTWNHVIFKRESSVGYAFLNGASRGSKSGFTNNFTSQILNIHNGWPSEFTQCRISSVKIYNKALTATEIYKNYLALKDRFS